MKKTIRFFGLAVWMILFSGCIRPGYITGPGRMALKNFSSPNGINEANLYLPPHEAMCLKVTDAVMKKGGTRVIREIFPGVLFGGETFPGRIAWRTLTVTSDGKYEVLGQSIISGLNLEADFTSVNVIDNIPGIENARTVRISSMGRFVYDSDGNEYSIDDWDKFRNDTNGYRKKLVLEKGSRVGDRGLARGFFKEANQWTKFQNGKGKFLCPLSREQKEYLKKIYPELKKEEMQAIQEKGLEEVASRNLQYTVSGKLLGSNPTIYTSPIQTLVDISIKTLEAYAGRVPSMGPDFDSVVTRRDMAITFEYPREVLKAYVEEINRVNANLLRKIDEMEGKHNGKGNVTK